MIKLHGVFTTDIITNSSSVVYSQATSVESLHSFINEILQAMGVDKKSEDVFDIVIVPSALEDIDDYLGDEFFELAGISESEFDKLDWKKRREIREAKGMELFLAGKIDISRFENEYGMVNTYYLVRQKDGTNTKIGKIVEGLFSHESVYE